MDFLSPDWPIYPRSMALDLLRGRGDYGAVPSLDLVLLNVGA